MHHLSVSRHIIPLKFSSWNICFWQKESISVQLSRLWRAVIKVDPIPHVMFETTRSGFIQILHHCSVSWKITTLYFNSNLVYFGICNFDRLLLLKVYKISAKKVQRSYVSWHWRMMQNLKKMQFVVSKMIRILVNFDPSTQKFQIFALWLVPFMKRI